jgi:hypothetical protein
MSVGNLKTEGLKGNNFPWQLALLKSLENVSNGLKDLEQCCSNQLAFQNRVLELLELLLSQTLNIEEDNL